MQPASVRTAHMSTYRASASHQAHIKTTFIQRIRNPHKIVLQHDLEQNLAQQSDSSQGRPKTAAMCLGRCRRQGIHIPPHAVPLRILMILLQAGQ